MNREELEKAFYDERRSKTVPFVVNDSVKIVSGPGEGKRASVISIETTTGGLAYLVEPGDGSGDLVVPADSLKAI